MTRTKSSKNGPKSPVIMVPGPKSLWGISVRGNHNHANPIICNRLSVWTVVTGTAFRASSSLDSAMHICPWPRRLERFRLRSLLRVLTWELLRLEYSGTSFCFQDFAWVEWDLGDIQGHAGYGSVDVDLSQEICRGCSMSPSHSLLRSKFNGHGTWLGWALIGRAVSCSLSSWLTSIRFEGPRKNLGILFQLVAPWVSTKTPLRSTRRNATCELAMFNLHDLVLTVLSAHVSNKFITSYEGNT